MKNISNKIWPFLLGCSLGAGLLLLCQELFLKEEKAVSIAPSSPSGAETFPKISSKGSVNTPLLDGLKSGNDLLTAPEGSAKQTPLQALITRFRWPTLNAHDLELSSALIEDFALTPDKVLAINAILKNTLTELKKLEKQNVTVELNKDGDQSLVIKPFNGELIKDRLSEDLKRIIDPDRAALLSALFNQDRVFGEFGRQQQKIYAENVITNVPEGNGDNPVLVLLESTDANGQLRHDSMTLTQAMYVQRFGQLATP